MNILTDLLPHNVEIDGKEVPINWGFRTSVKFAIIIEDADLKEEEKLLKGLELYYPTRERDIFNIKEAINKMLWFFNCGEVDEDDEYISKQIRASNKNSDKKAFSYKYDSDLIYPAFWEQYGIDLAEANIHWWKFRSLFSCLNDNLQISKIMNYRTADLSEMDKEQASFYRKMRKIYELPTNISTDEKKRLQALNKALSEGKDITGLI